MATEMTPFETEDWEEPDEKKFLEYSPDSAYLRDRLFYGVAGWLALRTASMVINILSRFDVNEWNPMDAQNARRFSVISVPPSSITSSITAFNLSRPHPDY